MKKRLPFMIFLIIALGISVILGFAKLPITKENIDETEVIEIDKSDILSTDDQAVKAEIAKYSDTKVDFRFDKRESFEDKNYDLTFSRMGCITSADETSYVTYTTDIGDELSYDLETGNIAMAYFSSLETEKNAESIDIIDAEPIAYDYASENCDIEKYVLTDKEERDNGYMFIYCKYIYGYRTNDRVRVLVGFDGNIVSATIRVYAIDDEKINVEKSWFEAQIEAVEENNENVIIEDTWIERDRHSDKIYFNIKCKSFDSYGNASFGVMQSEIK